MSGSVADSVIPPMWTATGAAYACGLLQWAGTGCLPAHSFDELLRVRRRRRQPLAILGMATLPRSAGSVESIAGSLITLG
jgi:hypothetical protein